MTTFDSWETELYHHGNMGIKKWGNKIWTLSKHCIIV